ncbi:N-acetyl-glucosamine-6-phosphate deacetylase [Ceratocystis pirilliformis]|uniref:N-acetylglucosamine-6-phosphate deacetylase n=1 Tax=Ceratocystis pirilliformis TaxID=259994 RepID=A0ABR3ZQP0_9PEZI
MPATTISVPSLPRTTKLTNCRLLRNSTFVPGDLWIDSATGKIIDAQAGFYDSGLAADAVIDMHNRIVSPGLIDVQLNGAFGFNFSTLLADDAQYSKKMALVNRQLIKTGVTSYLPTLTSQLPELYQKALPHLAPSGKLRRPADGAESLGAHVEGPFLNTTKNGVHNRSCFLTASSFASLEACYGAASLTPAYSALPNANGQSISSAIRMVTAAPELGRMTEEVIGELAKRGIVFSIGHSAATYDQALEALDAGASMVTHLFNAMLPLHHREPGVVGLLGGVSGRTMPSFGLIADGIHLHPAAVALAYKAHPEGLILVTDAMHLVGCDDGKYEFQMGDEMYKIVKQGSKLLLEGSETIAGSSITLLECINNFIAWTGASVAEALSAATETPAMVLGLGAVKGSLKHGADADLVVFSEESNSGTTKLVVEEVWKFGERVV